MHAIAIAALIAFALSYVVFAVSTMRRLSHYFDRVAALTGRMQERQATHGTDEGGENAFEREMRWKLIRGVPQPRVRPRKSAAGQHHAARAAIMIPATGRRITRVCAEIAQPARAAASPRRPAGGPRRWSRPR